jgi:hypothetical protein
MKSIAANVRHVDLFTLENPFANFAQAFTEWAALQDNLEFILKQLAEWTDESNVHSDPILNFYIQDARKRCIAIRAASPMLLEWIVCGNGEAAYTKKSCENYRQLTYTLGLICEKVAPDVFEALEENL